MTYAIRELIQAREKHQMSIEQINQQLVSAGYTEPIISATVPRVRLQPMGGVVEGGPKTKKTGKRVMSAETRARMAESQRLRWSKKK